MKKNILVAMIFGENPPHSFTDLEFMERHLRVGNRVSTVFCPAVMKACDKNPRHEPEICVKCMGWRAEGVQTLSAPVNHIPLLIPAEVRREADTFANLEFSSIADIKKVRLEDFELGYAVVSSFLLVDRDGSIERMRPVIRNLFWSGVVMYRIMCRVLDNERFDLVHLYNGRFILHRATMDACKSRNVPFITNEIGSTLDRFITVPNTFSMDFEAGITRMRKAWDDGPPEEEKVAIAKAYYEKRIKRDLPEMYNFAKGQKLGQLPEGWDPTKMNICIFTSSDDEMLGLGHDYDSRVFIYPSQVEGIEAIVRDLAERPDVHVYIKLHPRLKGTQNMSPERWQHIVEMGARLITADSLVDGYALIQALDRVVVFRSTVGIEAAYMGKPAIVAGLATYKTLGSTYEPANHAELMELLNRPELPPLPPIGAYIIGYYRHLTGELHHHFQLVRQGEFRELTQLEYFGSMNGRLVGIGAPAKSLIRALNSTRAGRYLTPRAWGLTTAFARVAMSPWLYARCRAVLCWILRVPKSEPQTSAAAPAAGFKPNAGA